MKITVTNGDSDIDRHIVESTLRLISEQPSDWVIKVTHTSAPDGLERSVEGTIAEYDDGILVIAETDAEAMHTGCSDTIDPIDVNEIEIF